MNYFVVIQHTCVKLQNVVVQELLLLTVYTNITVVCHFIGQKSNNTVLALEVIIFACIEVKYVDSIAMTSHQISHNLIFPLC